MAAVAQAIGLDWTGNESFPKPEITKIPDQLMHTLGTMS